jgi:hypothetical protein
MYVWGKITKNRFFTFKFSLDFHNFVSENTLHISKVNLVQKRKSTKIMIVCNYLRNTHCPIFFPDPPSLGDRCSFDVNCPENAVCDGGTCVCNRTYLAKGKVCHNGV